MVHITPVSSNIASYEFNIKTRPMLYTLCCVTLLPSFVDKLITKQVY